MRIDSHQYFTPQHPPEHLKPILERNRFDGSIVLDDGPVPERHDFIKGVIRRATPFDPKLGDRLDEWERDPLFKGVRFTLAGALPWGLGELAHRGLSLDLELDAAGLGWVPRIAEAAPDLRIAIDDLANPPYGAAITFALKSAPRDEERLEALARALVKRLLHEPTQRVKALGPEHRHARLQLLRELFGLEEAPASEGARPGEVRALRRP